MMLALLSNVSAPSSARSSGIRCSSLRYSGKAESMRPARDISLVSTVTPAESVKALIIGSSEKVASLGASSVSV